jgi:hypothetical protein
VRRTTFRETRAGPIRVDGERRTEPALLESRWRGQRGRLEVWYTTFTDPVVGTGVWLHHELVAGTDGSPPRAHGWATVFPPSAAPVFARFGPFDWVPGNAYQAGDVELSADRLRGRAGEISWDLVASGGGAPLYTFPRWAWERELLPAAQIVPMPTATYDGTVRWQDQVLDVRAAPGGTARIYGRGNAKRWAWLHADLGRGDVCEVVAATSTRRGLSVLPPLPFVRLRMAGGEWPPGDPLISALRMSAHIDLPTWTVRGRRKDRLIRIDVTQPPGETVTVNYTDPDGAPAVCRNTERAHAVITLQRRTWLGWEIARRWELHGTAHAEVGTRE